MAVEQDNVGGEEQDHIIKISYKMIKEIIGNSKGV